MSSALKNPESEASVLIDLPIKFAKELDTQGVGSFSRQRLCFCQLQTVMYLAFFVCCFLHDVHVFAAERRAQFDFLMTTANFTFFSCVDTRKIFAQETHK